MCMLLKANFGGGGPKQFFWPSVWLFGELFPSRAVLLDKSVYIMVLLLLLLVGSLSVVGNRKGLQY